MLSWNPSVSDTDHAGAGRYTLTVDGDGGLEMQGGGGRRFAFRPAPGGWTVQGSGSGSPRRLIRRPDGVMILEEERDGGHLMATWTPVQTGIPAVSGGTVLLADGDLFQVLDRPGPVHGYDLVGWQGGGAYFATGSGDGSLQLVIHPAGQALLEEDRGEVVLAIFVAVAAGL